MDIKALQEEIDAVSVLLYQNQEQEALLQMTRLFAKLKTVTDALQGVYDSDRQQIVSFVATMYQVLYEAYQHKDMLGMADGLQEYAVLATELYKVKC